MKKVILISGFILFIIVMTTIKNIVQNTRESITPPSPLNDKGVKLFNGYNLDGW